CSRTAWSSLAQTRRVDSRLASVKSACEAVASVRSALVKLAACSFPSDKSASRKSQLERLALSIFARMNTVFTNDLPDKLTSDNLQPINSIPLQFCGNPASFWRSWSCREAPSMRAEVKSAPATMFSTHVVDLSADREKTTSVKFELTRLA